MARHGRRLGLLLGTALACAADAASIATVAVEASGDLAWETGTNRVVVQVGDAAPTTRTGRYLVAWKRGSDGQWRYRVDAVIPDPAG